MKMSKPNTKDLSKREMMSLAEVHSAFGIARSTMYRKRSQGLISFTKVGSRTKVRRRDVEKLFKPWKPGCKPQAGRA